MIQIKNRNNLDYNIIITGLGKITCQKINQDRVCCGSMFYFPYDMQDF